MALLVNACLRLKSSALLGLLLAWPSDRLGAKEANGSSSTVYVGRHFEVRDNDQPVKYIFEGESRIARVTGSLNSSSRIQRLRLFAGWNLCSLAVTATNFVHQATNAHPGVIRSLLVWDPPTQSWLEVVAGQTLPAASILWLEAASHAVLPITGAYEDPTNKMVPGSGAFVAGSGLEAWDLRSALSNVPSATAFMYDSGHPGWISKLPPALEQPSAFPDSLPSGSAMFIQADSLFELAAPDSALRIRYYHHDHLGSSSAVTDDEGTIVEETCFYPFGASRHEFEPKNLREAYKFTQKERDRESALHYFEARYQSATLSRFLTPDMKYADPDSLVAADLASFLFNPQKINLYAYVLNNPLKFVDPTGLDDKPAKRKVLVAYTRDMFTDAQSRMQIPNRAAYHKSLAATYQPEAGENAEIIVRNLESWKDLAAVLKGSSFDAVIVNTHAYGNDKAMFMGEDKTYDSLHIDKLEKFLRGAKSVPKHIFFYGCNTANSGLASDLSGRFPDIEVTGTSSVIQQKVHIKTKNDKPVAYNISENRDYNLTFKGGNKTKDARTVTIDPNAPLPR